ncbi:hypothetical protein TCAL_16087 [Tigriopus californicus]|uniref:CX domain-containing protein n=1 Tax=Tigriopus californicus TaxID=6832 RepID=A0A553PNL0_TIGCA|nr:uncharacterized protein LOC131882688 [Tigriopus californicus]TRY79257.1 hypothetical protein TCAL_16087 [Tigriopus californicus]
MSKDDLSQIIGLHLFLLQWVLTKAHHEYHQDGKVICSREKSISTWYTTEYEYFSCKMKEHCCGDPWKRKCCNESTNPHEVIIIVAVVLVVGFFISLAIVAFVNYKRRTRLYEVVEKWWAIAKPSEFKPNSSPGQANSARGPPRNVLPMAMPIPLATGLNLSNPGEPRRKSSRRQPTATPSVLSTQIYYPGAPIPIHKPAPSVYTIP